MPALPETQALVLGALLGRHDAGAATRLLRAGSGLPAARRLQIYRNNLLASLGDALAAVFPVVARLVGEQCFGRLARDFVESHPLRSGSLHDFGRELPEWIADRPSLRSLPYLVDVARLEWACHEVYHEADEGALAPEQLARVAPDRTWSLRLRPVRATRVIASPYPVLRIWASNQPGSADAGAISLDEGGVRLLVARRDGDVEFRTLGESEDLWLRTLAAGATLIEATGSALAQDAGFDLGHALGRHLSLGTFAPLVDGAGP